MWKGYREAQVAWSVISSATTPDGRRDCLGAVFYVPRRGILELWDIAGLQRIGALMVTILWPRTCSAARLFSFCNI